MKKNQQYTPINKGQFSFEPLERIESFEANRGCGVEEDYKQNRSDWVKFALDKTVSKYPMHVDIELASICNLKCPMCYTITDSFKEKVNAKLMNFEMFKKIVDECAEGGVYSIRLSYRGESFLHKKILDCVYYAKMKGIKEVSTLTNGLRLNEELFTELMFAGLDWLTISIDGLNEVYEKVRYPAKFPKALSKIQNYSEIKKENEFVKPVITIQSILPAIEDNPNAFYDTFKDISDKVTCNPLIDFHDDLSTMPKIENFHCPQLYQRLVIGADGLCMMCANDEDGQVIIGDFKNQTVHEIWHSHELNRVRKLHSENKFRDVSPCNQCYLPLETKEASIQIDNRNVIAQKYASGVSKVKDLKNQTKREIEI
jgi:radical SAM protein with 4Fe4S-binding SPASM domain